MDLLGCWCICAAVGLQEIKVRRHGEVRSALSNETNKPHLPGKHRFHPTWRHLNYSRCILIILPDL